jgi:hypothetical protein
MQKANLVSLVYEMIRYMEHTEICEKANSPYSQIPVDQV